MSSKQISLEELAKVTKSTLVGDPKRVVTGVADIESAGPNDISFLSNPRYATAMKNSPAAVVFIHHDIPPIEGRNFLINEDPSRAFQHAVEFFYTSPREATGFQGIHPTAVIHPDAKLGDNVTIGPLVTIDRGTKIGNNTFISAGCHLCAEVVIGENCLFYPNVVIREQCVVGNRVVIQPGVVIGSCGFGFTTDKKGEHLRLNHMGNVILEDDVEIFANTVIERARFQHTVIGKGSKIGNLVIIGHNVHVGQHNIIVAQTGIAGSSKTGKHVVLAAQVGVTGHIELEDGVMVAACSGVSKSLKKGKYSGVPAVPIDEYSENAVLLRNIKSHVKRIKDLEARLEALENK